MVDTVHGILVADDYPDTTDGDLSPALLAEKASCKGGVYQPLAMEWAIMPVVTNTITKRISA
ncbi:hypothetical protein J2D73_19080 [Acetobacter sacchari]|uniref:Uncharacterized protein n=1 Tax=Acetobacter sacchari TaxID=2661687 RepID=A0ABS3M161_9PROT|nr:hypothetical protein [Acetobacter sacchari]MBO1361889.1 hypothetical protein [Acetobacter sacchari]